MLKLNYKKLALLFVCMLFIFTLIAGSKVSISNLAYIPGHFMDEDFVKFLNIIF